MDESRHVSVLLREVVEVLRANQGGRFLDCTLGGAGHAEAILSASPETSLVACDRDQRAIDRARVRLAPFGERVSFCLGRFSQVDVGGGGAFDGMLADLGLSTDQLFEGRGFSFHDEVALDMRMDERADLTAEGVVNGYSERDLIQMLRRGGVGQEAPLVARVIVRERPFGSTAALAKCINRALASRGTKKKTNPSTVVFQAIRIEVNDEIGEIEGLLQRAPSLVKAGGRLAIITFHSLEDKIVTRTMREWDAKGAVPASWRGPKPESKGRLLQNSAIVPSEEELQMNPSSRSARLRVFEFSEPEGQEYGDRA